jgi:hypothetical protein
MSARWSVSVYRRLTVMYPKSFRDEYGSDLVAAFRQQLHDEGPSRVWLSTLGDLIVTIPSQHLEVHMKRPTPHTVAVIATSLTVAALVLAVAAGTGPVVGVFLFVAVAALAVATIAWKAARPAGLVEVCVAGRWRTYLTVGVALLAVTIMAINVPPYNEALMMLSLVTGVALTTVGLTIGIARRSTPVRPD